MSPMGISLGIGIGIGQGQGGGGSPSLDPLTLTKAPSYAFSVRKLSSYSGPFGKDESAADIDFVGNAVPSVAKRISALYDQIGGTVLATQPTDANRPAVEPTYGMIGDNQALMFDGANSGVALGRTRELILDTSIVLASRDHTVIHVVQNVTGNAASALGGQANVDGVSNDVFYQIILQGIALRGTAITNQTQGVYPPSNPGCFAIGADATNTRLRMFDRTFNRTLPTTAVDSAGGKIGNAATGTANQRGTFKWLGSFYYAPALTAGELTTAMSELATGFGLQTTFDTQIVYDGDSNTEGTGSDNCRVAPVAVQNELRKPARVHNFANFGNTAQAVAALGTGRYSIAAAGWTQTSRLGVIGLGTNDVIGSRTTAQIIADLQTIVNSMVSVGITQVVMRTIPKASSITAAKETVRQEVNTAILGGTITGLAGTSNIADDPLLQVPASDGLHWDGAQQERIAQLDAAALNPLTW